MMPELLLRPDLGRMVRRLKCRFTIDAAPRHPYMRAIWERDLEKAKYKAMEWFEADMVKEGWTYVDKFPVQMKGPFVAISPVTIPSQAQRARWHIPAWELMPAIMAGYRPDLDMEADRRKHGELVTTLPDIDCADKWEFELRAVFARPRIRVEAPSEKEEREEMAKP